MLNAKDISDIKERGSHPEELEKQLERFRLGTQSPELVAPCTPEEGIAVLEDSEKAFHEGVFQEQRQAFRIKRFVPASGAASRMFKHLLAQRAGEQGSLARDFLNQLESFPFWPEVEKHLHRLGKPSDTGILRKEASLIWEVLFDEMKLDRLPKGMIPFHSYGLRSRTAFEEQLREGSWYATDRGSSHTHFTLAANHRINVERTLDSLIGSLAEEGIEAAYSTSVQHPSTDTIALDENGALFRDESGKLLFRPGGHGALLRNLAELEADLVFIKNIDNVVPDHLKNEALEFKSILAGYAIGLYREAKSWLDELSKPDELVDWSGLNNFIANRLQVRGLTVADKPSARDILNRPIRVCGMVQNQGEPGGGPFWVRMRDGSIRPQIVEKAQVDLSDPAQAAILQSATHFNPVDIVAMLKTPSGELPNFNAHVAEEWAFIAEKSYQGRKLRALEHPGLWNGGMAYWNTVFIEVPLLSFNPVKTVNDLLRPAHRAILEQP